MASIHKQLFLDARPDDGSRTRLVWITDVLPDEIAPAISALVEAGAAAIARRFERSR